MYTALSEVKTYKNLYCIGEFKICDTNKDALLEYERLRQNNLFSMIKRNAISRDTLTLLPLNVRSLPRHVDDTVSDSRIKNNDVIGFTQIQIKASDCTSEIIQTLNFFNVTLLNKID